MAYVKNPSDKQKKMWMMQSRQQEQEMKALIQNLAESYRENPENIAELLSFGSKFYKYSVRNNMLLYAQNPGLTYVQSFRAWKDMGASIKKGEKGLKVYVPVKATILKIGNDLVPLEQATPKQRIQYQAGEIDSITQTHFKLGIVFDIAQTTFPKEQYPKLFFMGYPSEHHADIIKGLSEYAAESLNCPVTIMNMESITRRGCYLPELNEIHLNELLEDTQRLSTLSHELGHALLHREPGKSSAQKELEADALGIMLESYFGIEPTDARKRHLADCYRSYQEEYGQEPGKPSFGQILTNVYRVCKRSFPDIKQAVEKYVHLDKTGMKMVRNIAERSQKISKEAVYDEIKRQVQIVDYAAAHQFELRRKGRYFTMKEHDSVIIDTEKNYFWRNSGIGLNPSGSVIDFALEFVHDGNMQAALSELNNMVYMPETMSYPSLSSTPKAKSGMRTERKLAVELPEKAENMRRAYAYLVKSRYIDQDIVQEFVDRKMLYQDVRGNCVFVAYDSNGNPNYATFRGTLTEKKFLGDVPGNDYNRGYYIDNRAEKLIVTESVIDAMSVMSILKGQGEEYHAYDYLVLTGTTKYETILSHLKEEPKKEVLLSLDHDLAGVIGMQKLEGLIKENGIDTKITNHVPKGKDWSQDLTDAGKKFQPLETIPYLEEKELPKIHMCAIQSTEQMQESGFRIREGRHQYRLVELEENGTLRPVQLEERNVIYFSPEEIKKRIPNMYQLIKYPELETLQNNLLQELKNESPKASYEHDKTAMEETFRVKRFYVDHETVMGEGTYLGKEENGGVWKREGVYYALTGYAFDDSLKEHILDKEAMNKLQEETGLSSEDLGKFPDGLLYFGEGSEMTAEIGKKPIHAIEKQDNTFLERIRRQEYQKNLQTTPKMGMSMQMEL